LLLAEFLSNPSSKSLFATIAAIGER
jgi:hypothetical protein